MLRSLVSVLAILSYAAAYGECENLALDPTQVANIFCPRPKFH